MSEHGRVRKRSDTHDDDDDDDDDDSRRTNISRADGNDTRAEEMTSENWCDSFGK
jgi:hypothetical protein